MKNIAVYSRKSCVTDKGESIQNQINICKDYIFSHIDKSENCNLIFYKDEGFSAKNTDRPEFKKMIRDAENKKFSHVVCYRLDRISRNVNDFSRLIDRFNKSNISFICVKEQFDTSVPMGRAMMYIASVFAQLERETIAERVKDNMVMLSKHGQWLGGTTPLGMKSYKVINKNVDANSKCKFYLKENKEELETVKMIYYKFLELQSLTETKKYLDSVNIKSRNNKQFSIPAIKKILTNPVYCCADRCARNYFDELGANVCFSSYECSSSVGIIAYNKRNYKKSSGKINNFSDWIIALGSHKGVIEGKTWIKINRIINFKKNINKFNNSLLDGKIICKICQSKMLTKKRTDNRTFDYICASKIYNSSQKCSCKNLSGKNTDEIISRQMVLKGIQDNNFFIKKLNILKRNLQSRLGMEYFKTENTNLNPHKLTEKICEYVSPTFIDKTINFVFWDNTDLIVELKNCNY